MQAFKTILFAADFSENSKEAFRAACSLAIEKETRLVVLHVVEPKFVPEDPVYLGQQAVQFYPAEPDMARHESVRAKMREIYVPDHPLDAEYQTKEGAPAEEILKGACEIGCDLIVMGTHGRTGLRWLLAGSVAVAVVHEAACPVLAVRVPEQCHAAKPIMVILHPTDFSVHSESALRVARALARYHGAQLIILHVAMLEFLMDGTPAGEVDPGVDRDALEQIRKRVDGADLKYPVKTVLERGYAPEGILQTAQEMDCDLIVMGTHGRTGLSRLLMGSVAENVLPKAACPVLMMKGGQRRSTVASTSHPEEMICG